MNKGIEVKGRLKLYLLLPVILTILLLLLTIPMYYYDVRYGLAVSVFMLIFLAGMILVYRKCKPLLVNELVNFATQYATVQKKILQEFEVPYTLLDYTGRLLWANDEFYAMTGAGKNYHKSIMTLFPAITRELLQKSGELDDFYLEREGRRFRISIKKIHFETIVKESELVQIENGDEFLTAVYFFDETLLNRYRVENEEQRQVAALVYIDNYDEALDSIEDVKRALLVALVDRKVNKYFSGIDALVRKIEKDKYFVVFKYKHLQELRQDRFSILEDVKTVKVGNEMAVSLSIGVGLKADSYNQSYEYARNAIDLALGRGGDQVVVKEEEEISYYGGKAKQVERNTRVKARVKAQALREIMETHENVIIMGHALTDMDALGAGIGVYCAARLLGKRAHIVLHNPISMTRSWVKCFTPEKGYPQDMFIDTEAAMEMTGANTLVMVVDTNRPSYTECPALLLQTDAVVVFDHHRQSNEVIKNTLLSYIEPYASSSCEMVAEVLQYFDAALHLSPLEADCIYAGMQVDTTNFLAKTGVRTFEAAVYLKRSGADVTRVRKMLRDDLTAYKARAEVVRNSEVFHTQFAIGVCPAEGLDSPTVVCAQAANELLNVIGIKASFVLTDFNGKIFVSARSLDEINVQLIMERLGGGGHLNVAGAQLTDYSLPEAKQLVKDTIDTMLNEGAIGK